MLINFFLDFGRVGKTSLMNQYVRDSFLLIVASIWRVFLCLNCICDLWLLLFLNLGMWTVSSVINIRLPLVLIFSPRKFNLKIGSSHCRWGTWECNTFLDNNVEFIFTHLNFSAASLHNLLRRMCHLRKNVSMPF